MASSDYCLSSSGRSFAFFITGGPSSSMSSGRTQEGIVPSGSTIMSPPPLSTSLQGGSEAVSLRISGSRLRVLEGSRVKRLIG